MSEHLVSSFIRLNDLKTFFAHRFTKRRAKSLKNKNRDSVFDDFDEATFTPEIECTIITKANQIAPEDQFVVTGDKTSMISGDGDYIMNMILEAEKKNREMVEKRSTQMIKGIGQVML